MESVDVLVIGAGLAGLRTSQLLLGKGYSVVLLEANDRVGGRTTGTEWNGYQWDLGGQWLGPTQDRMYKLVEELGMATFPQYVTGRKGFMFRDGSVKHYSGTVPPLNILGLLEAQFAIWYWQWKIKQYPLDRNIELWTLPDAEKWDSMTVSTWCDTYMWTKTAKDLMNQATRGVLGAEHKDVSMLLWLHYMRGAGRETESADPERLLVVTNGAQQDRIKGGSYTVSQRLAAKLPSGVLRMREAVTRIDQQEEGVTVHTNNGRSYSAKYVVVCIPPVLAGRITYSPPLPSSRDELTQRFSMGRIIKCLAFYRDSWWRKKGFSGEVVTEDSIITMGFEASLPDDSAHALVAFVCGDYARELSLLTEEARKKKVLACLAAIFGSEALDTIHYMDKDWCSEQWARGAYTGYTPPGVLSSLGDAVRKPIGRIHWAGTETARVWQGYMEGAVESAERVSEEVHARLQGREIPTPTSSVPVGRKKSTLGSSQRKGGVHTLLLLLVTVGVLAASYYYLKLFR